MEATPEIDELCAVLIPSSSEPDIADTIHSIGRQLRRPAVTLVVLNNCHDGGATRKLASETGALYDINLVILEMERNDHMKSGALNWPFRF